MVATAAGSLAVVAVCRRQALRRCLFLPACALALAAAATFEALAREPPVPEPLQAAVDAREGANRLWVGTVVGIPAPEAAGTRVVFRLAGVVAGERSPPVLASVAGRVTSTVPGPPPAPGEWWLLRGIVALEPGRRNPGGLDRAAWAARRGIAGRLMVSGPVAARRLGERPPLLRRPGLGVPDLLARWRARAHAALAAHLAPEAAGLAEAMALGMRGSLAPETMAGFRHLGWQHLIAVSGMNIGFVLGLALALLHFARIRRATWPLIVIVLLYTVLTGAEAPVVRAAIMAGLGFLARACDRALSTGRALAVAGLIGLALAPRWLEDPSFQLSFAALAGMGLLGPQIDWAHPLAFLAGRGALARCLVLPLWSGLAAQIGCLPILASTFHWLSPWGVLTGPVAIPHAALLVSAVLLGLVMLALPQGPLEGLGLQGAGVITEALLATERLGARGLPPPWPLAVPGPAATVVLIGSLACLPLLRRRPRWRNATILVASAGALIMIGGLPPARGQPARVEVVFLDVGQGDAGLVLVHGARGWPERLGALRRPQAALVIDVGDRPSAAFDAGSAVVAQALATAGVRVVDSVILSHGDRDHRGGLEGLARALPVREIVWPRPLPLPETVDRLTRPGGAGSRGRCVLRLAVGGDTLLARPGLVAIAVHPSPNHAGGENDGSLVVRLEMFGGRVLFAGDLEAPGESTICAQQQDLAAEVVKVPHHGSRTSSSQPFVNATGARHAVVSVGARNRFGHPDAGVLERWRLAGSRVWRTDKCGAVIAIFEPGRIEVKGLRGG